MFFKSKNLYLKNMWKYRNTAVLHILILHYLESRQDQNTELSSEQI
jgi:hypothetical protein